MLDGVIHEHDGMAHDGIRYGVVDVCGFRCNTLLSPGCNVQREGHPSALTLGLPQHPPVVLVAPHLKHAKKFHDE